MNVYVLYLLDLTVGVSYIPGSILRPEHHQTASGGIAELRIIVCVMQNYGLCIDGRRVALTLQKLDSLRTYACTWSLDIEPHKLLYKYFRS